MYGNKGSFDDRSKKYHDSQTGGPVGGQPTDSPPGQAATPRTDPDLAPLWTLLRLEAQREQNWKTSVVGVIEEAAELYARFRNSHEIEEFAKLTPRLQEVLRLIADGLLTKEIAAHLNISQKTVEFHRRRLTKKLGIRATALLARYAVRVGATPP
jgi:DNA-binding NarL/FixJ family response regulator